MVQVVWTDPALSDLDAIADYIAVQNPVAGALLVARVFSHFGQLAAHPKRGSKLIGFKRSRYRQLIKPPCRVVYRFDGKQVFILHVMRSERLLRAVSLRRK